MRDRDGDRASVGQAVVCVGPGKRQGGGEGGREGEGDDNRFVGQQEQERLCELGVTDGSGREAGGGEEVLG